MDPRQEALWLREPLLLARPVEHRVPEDAVAFNTFVAKESAESPRRQQSTGRPTGRGISMAATPQAAQLAEQGADQCNAMATPHPDYESVAS
mmetsp:Transcript_22562/g.71569  ORF Transcript_22562/g.71569 Transcript_22562/m.71569 type:complete len:92 (-) Transcript_22562:19-294(-)